MEKILLVEDARELAQAMQEELRTNGYHVLYACDGISALRVYNEQHPDLVILDWMLPGLNGLEVLRQLRQQAPTPVLMLTARGDIADRVEGLEMGADDYLTKPFSMRELIARVRVLLRHVEVIRQITSHDRSNSDTALSYGPLRLDIQTHQATLYQKPLVLNPAEFRLLHLLMRNPGRAFHRPYLLSTIWGETFDGTERTVDTAIVRLRKKLGDSGEAIETVWGVGYRLRKERKQV